MCGNKMRTLIRVSGNKSRDSRILSGRELSKWDSGCGRWDVKHTAGEFGLAINVQKSAVPVVDILPGGSS